MSTPRTLLASSILLLLLHAAAALAGEPPARPDLIAIGIAPLESDRASKVQAAVETLVGRERAGATVMAFDLHSARLECVASFVIPDVPERARLNRCAAGLAAIRAAMLPRGSGDGSGIRVPEFLRLVSALPARQAAGRTIVGVFGSMYYRSAENPGSFGAGEVPADAWVTSRLATVYSTHGRASALENLCAHWCYTDAGCSHAQMEAVKRFWGLLLSTQSGVLASFEADPATVVQNMMSRSAAPVCTATADPLSTELTIRRVAEPPFTPEPPEPPPPPPAPPPSPVAAPASSAEARVAAVAPGVPAPSTEAGVTIAAVWASAAGQVDLDLWVGSSPGVKELCYAHTSSPDGRYLRDVRRSLSREAADWVGQWEAVELTRVPENLTVWVDQFAGDGQAVRGLVRFRFGSGRIVDASFTLAGGRGDGASARDRREKDSNWLRIDVPRD